MATTKNYYKTLGVAKNASFADIKKRYRELAKKHHPDVNNGSAKAENNFKIISAAYNVLSNKKRRQEYDQTTRQQQSRPKGRGPNNWSDPSDDFDFNGRQKSGPKSDFRQTTPEEEQKFDPEFPTRGFDLQFMLDLPLVTIALGGTIPYSYEKYVQCPDCEGTGYVHSEECIICKGKRLVVEGVTIEVKIPPGIGNLYTLRVPDSGGEGRNSGPPGDLLLRISAEKHPRFKRLKDDIYAEISISPELAENGGSVEIETLDSVQTIEVEEGTLTGEELRIPGQGACINWGKKRGDFIVKFKIEEP